MADFIDDEASEASSSDEEVRGETGSKRGKKKVQKVDDSSEEDEEDEEDEEEMKDLINDEEEEGDDEDDQSDSDDEGAGEKRSHDSDVSSSLEEDDLDLIQENLGVRIPKKKKYKRIRKVDDDDSEEEEHDEGRKIQNELFGPNDLLESDEEDVQKQRSRPAEKELDLDVDEYEDDSDSEDNFIVDDNDQPLARKPKRKGARYNDSAMQQAQEIFGVDFDFEDMEEDFDDYGGEGEYDDQYEDEETGELKTRRKPRAGRKTIYDIYEPAELERSHLTSFDQEVRAKDEPERFQLRSIPVTSADDDEIKAEADWIWSNAFNEPTLSIQMLDREPIAGKLSGAIKEEIEYTLKYIRNEKLEVPYISNYNREYVPTLTYDPEIGDSDKHLWTIYRYDEQWCKLQASKRSLQGLYRDMRTYIESRPADSRLRKIEDSDLERVHSAKTFHDIEDCRLHFKLYYSQLTTEMKLYTLEKKIQEQKELREQRVKERLEKKSQSQNGLEHEGGADKEGGDDDEDIQSVDKPQDGNEADEEDEVEEPGETEEEKLYKRLSKFKISSSRDRYQAARENYLGEIVTKFGLTPEQFGENLRDDYQKNSVTQHSIRPLDEAAKHCKSGTRFSTKEEVLEAAKLMYSRELSCDPLVRQTVRNHYFNNAHINVKPTLLGMKEIDENHPCYTLKFLKNKPVSRLVGDQILHLLNAEKDKHIEVKFSIERTLDDGIEQLSPYFESLKALYYSDFYSSVTNEWNDLRKEAINSALSNMVLPCLEKQLREKLVKEAQDRIIRESGEKLFKWLNVAPYVPMGSFDNYEDFELNNGIRICGFTFDPEGEAPCFAAIVDADGELIDHVRLPYLNIRKRSDRLNAVERANLEKDRAKFKQFMINRKPHVVALAAETIQTKSICTYTLAPILDELRQHDNLPLIHIEIVDNELSSVYKNLKRANEEFPDFPPLLLQAISNARKLNDPLTEYAKLCTPDNDITCLHFHSLQNDLPKEDLLDTLYQHFTSRVCAVGVDPNRVIAHPHTTNIVQFIAGLGPRKGAHLLRSIKKSKTGGQLVSRQQLVTELGMTKVIFINCSAFIKLDTNNLADEYPDEHVTPLDCTRIHPSSYGYAKKIAVDAANEGEDDGDISEETFLNAIETLQDTQGEEMLNSLDLAAFADQLERTEGAKKSYTLQVIREELWRPFKEKRIPIADGPGNEEIFAMLTKETPTTFYVGKLITCQVVQIVRKRPTNAQMDVANPVKIDDSNLWRCPFCMRSDFQDLSIVWHHFDNNDCPGYAIGVKCRLDNGLYGFIPTKFISDKEISDPSDRVATGQTIHARVIKVDAEKFSCDLTCRTSDLLDEMGKLKLQKDEFYDYDGEKKARHEMEARRTRSVRQPYCKRVIVHPAFENIDCKTCERKLKDLEQGHAIIRPSSQGQNFLTLSWKVADGIFQHVTIREEEKRNAFSLGQQLYIESEVFEDLDEIIARYVQPMAAYTRELLNYKYCLKLQDGIEEEPIMSNALITAKTSASCLPYKFCPSRRYPGKFLLGYMPKDKPKIEYLTVTPAGYRFRKQYFRSLHHLIKWFKENWNWTTNMMSIHGSVPMSQ